MQIDIKARKLNNSYPFTAESCTGTHSIGFSRINLQYATNKKLTCFNSC